MAKGFLLISIVEARVRAVIVGRFTLDELRAVRSPESTRSICDVGDMSMGEYQRLLEIPEHWARLSIDLDRHEFVWCLDAARAARNDIVHFRATGDDIDVRPLEQMVRLLRCF